MGFTGVSVATIFFFFKAPIALPNSNSAGMVRRNFYLF